jgi:AcrR family transcriptional regulator
LPDSAAADGYPAVMADRSADRTTGDGIAPSGAASPPAASPPAAAPRPLLERRDRGATRAALIEAGRTALLTDGFARLSSRRVADLAGVPVSQIHYHFGSMQQLVLAILADQNERLLERQARMFATSDPLWRQWEQACEFLEADLASGYVRILQEMVAAGWSDSEVAASVRTLLGGWYGLLADVARRDRDELGGLGPFTPEEVSALMGLPFLGAEAMLLLGFTESELPIRSALRKIGDVFRMMERGSDGDGDGPDA